MELQEDVWENIRKTWGGSTNQSQTHNYYRTLRFQEGIGTEDARSPQFHGVDPARKKGRLRNSEETFNWYKNTVRGVCP